MEKLEKWQPKHKVSTARGRKQRMGYSNIGQHSGRQGLAHGYVEQMEKGDTTMTIEEQARLNNAVVQLEKIAGLGAVAGAAKKAAGAVSGAAKKIGGGGGGDAPTPKTPNFYETAKVSRGKGATSRDWKVQGTPAIKTGPYGQAYERVRTDVTEAQRAKRTGDPVKQTGTAADKLGRSRLARAFGATKRAAGGFAGGFREGLGEGVRFQPRGSSPRKRAEAQKPSAARWHKYSQRGGGNKAANPYGDASSRQAFASAQEKKAAPEKARSYKSSSQGRNRLGIRKSLEKAMISLQKVADGDIFIQNRGPVDRLTGGRVKFENKPEKQYAPNKVDWTGRELQVSGPNNKLMRATAAAVGAKKPVTPSDKADRTKRATKAAGLEYAPKMQKAVVSLQKFLDDGDTDVPVEKGIRSYVRGVKQRFKEQAASNERWGTSKQRTARYKEGREQQKVANDRIRNMPEAEKEALRANFATAAARGRERSRANQEQFKQDNPHLKPGIDFHYDNSAPPPPGEVKKSADSECGCSD